MGCEGFIAGRLSKRIAVALTCAASTSPCLADGRAVSSCEDLSGEAPPGVIVGIAQSVEAGQFTAPDGSRSDVPAFCRVRGEARPTAQSRITFELWMPARDWNGRYYQLGNGGFAGNIHYPSLAAELKRGNAVAITDTGHEGNGVDAGWAHGQPQKIIDYGWRSLQQTSDAARGLIRAYYGDGPRHSYFAGCSNGGRQALMLAQRYPEDWDGILAGAPALYWTRQLASFASAQHALRSRAESWIAPSKLPAIQQAALASCSEHARVSDGIASEPRHCRFDPASLACEAEETDQCLTHAQVAALTVVIDGPRDETTGAPLYFGFDPTAAAYGGNWDYVILDRPAVPGSQLALAEQFFRHMVQDDGGWTVNRYTPQDLATAQRRQVEGRPLSSVLDADDPDLGRYARSGGKLLMYFGWADALISPFAAVDYYEQVTRHAGGLQKTQAFFRLFMVPGMMHCQGGPGATAFGQSHVTPGLRDDPEHDMRRALEAWVERGRAPESIVAAKYANDDPARGVMATRRLCAYPAICE